MENLIKNYKKNIESLRNETIEKIQNAEKRPAGEFIFILTGKMLAFDICLKEIELLLNYHDESSKYENIPGK
jgi:hypothetical protein